MMEVRELRIGNLVSFYGDRNVHITGISKKTVRHKGLICCVSGLEPIQLTEEWLVKFGCVKYTANAKGIGEFDWYQLPNGMDLCWVLASACWVRIESINSITIKHVHQLQNLYHALTGKELTIQP